MKQMVKKVYEKILDQPEGSSACSGNMVWLSHLNDIVIYGGLLQFLCIISCIGDIGIITHSLQCKKSLPYVDIMRVCDQASAPKPKILQFFKIQHGWLTSSCHTISIFIHTYWPIIKCTLPKTING
jgi:hypothetical protein